MHLDPLEDPYCSTDHFLGGPRVYHKLLDNIRVTQVRAIILVVQTKGSAGIYVPYVDVSYLIHSVQNLELYPI